jgi:hypothetical protein
MTAAPQQSNVADLLNVVIKLDNFVRDRSGNPT